MPKAQDTIEKIKIKDLTFEQYRQFHKELWTWLAETGDANKLNWPGWDKFDRIPQLMCFACVVVGGLGYIDPSDCKHCPIQWPDDRNYNNSNDKSLWYEWCYCKTAEERKVVSKQIADLPWKKV